MSIRILYNYPPEFKSLKGRRRFFVNPCQQLKQRLSCVKCMDILVEPYQMYCGCRFCSQCLKTCKNVCPECGIDSSSKTKNNLIKFDNAAEREIFELEVKCIYEHCMYTCKFKDLSSHLEKCNKCADCGLDLSENHRNINGDISLLCDNWKGVCPHNCSEEVIENIKMHLKDCPKMIVVCPMKEVGCSKRLPKLEMEDHVKNNISYHMNLMTQKIIKLKTENERIKSESLKNNNNQNAEIKLLKETIADSTMQINNLREKTSSCEKNYQVNSSNFGVHTYTFNHVSSKEVSTYIQKLPNTFTMIDNTVIPGFKLCLELAVDVFSNCFEVRTKIQLRLPGNPSEYFRKMINTKWSTSPNFDSDRIFYLSNDCNFIDGIWYTVGVITMPIVDFRTNYLHNDKLVVHVEVVDEINMESRATID